MSQVLQRKTEEAAMATKRLKELLEARKSSARDNSGMFVVFFVRILAEISDSFYTRSISWITNTFHRLNAFKKKKKKLVHEFSVSEGFA